MIKLKAVCLKSVQFSHRKVIKSITVRQATDVFRAECPVPVEELSFWQWQNTHVKKQLLNVVSKQ